MSLDFDLILSLYLQQYHWKQHFVIGQFRSNSTSSLIAIFDNDVFHLSHFLFVHLCKGDFISFVHAFSLKTFISCLWCVKSILFKYRSNWLVLKSCLKCLAKVNEKRNERALREKMKQYCCKTVWNFIALIWFKWEAHFIVENVYQSKNDCFIKQAVVTKKRERERAQWASVLWWYESKLICHFKEIKIQVLHRWNVLISEENTMGSFVELICARAMIDLFQFSSGKRTWEIKKANRRKCKCVNPRFHFLFSLRFVWWTERYKWSSSDNCQCSRSAHGEREKYLKCSSTLEWSGLSPLSIISSLRD